MAAEDLLGALPPIYAAYIAGIGSHILPERGSHPDEAPVAAPDLRSLRVQP